MKLVKFSNGKYGVRQFTIFGYKYLDLTCPRFSWRKKSDYFGDCQGTEESCRRAMEKFGIGLTDEVVE